MPGATLNEMPWSTSVSPPPYRKETLRNSTAPRRTTAEAPGESFSEGSVPSTSNTRSEEADARAMFMIIMESIISDISICMR